MKLHTMKLPFLSSSLVTIFARLEWECTIVFWGSIIGQKIFAQNRGFIIGKVVKNMISEGKQR